MCSRSSKKGFSAEKLQIRSNEKQLKMWRTQQIMEPVKAEYQCGDRKQVNERPQRWKQKSQMRSRMVLLARSKLRIFA